MSASDLILSVDIGTSATKAVLFDTDLQQIAIARKHYPTHSPHKGWSEQEPEAVFDAVLGALQEIAHSVRKGSRLLGVGFSSQLYSLMAVDANGQPLTNSMTWSDTRSAENAQWISRHPKAQGVQQRTGCPVDAMYPLAKIMWLKANLELPGSARFVSIKEFVLFRLIGQWVVDWSVASATGLFDIREGRWDEAALSLLGITPAHLSELVSPRRVFAQWNQGPMRLIGLPPGIPLIVGGGDGPLASIGAGACSSRALAVNVGTSAAARLTIPEARVDPKGRLWTYVVDEDLWVIGGMVSSGGNVYDWALRTFFSGTEGSEEDGLTQRVHEYADGLASAVPPGADDLIFIPYLQGEQCPGWRPHTRGGFFGLGFGHNRGHLVRAVLEGITRSIYVISRSIQSVLDVRFDEIRVTGGLTASPLWLQIAADMFGTPIVVPESAEGSARGAAMLAMISLGLRSGLRDFAGTVTAQSYVHPREEIHAYYETQYKAFKELLDLSRKP